MKKVWVHVSHSFKEAEEFDREYYFKMSPQERLNIMQQLREMYYKFPKFRRENNGYRTRLQKVVRVVKQA